MLVKSRHEFAGAIEKRRFLVSQFLRVYDSHDHGSLGPSSILNPSFFNREHASVMYLCLGFTSCKSGYD